MCTSEIKNQTKHTKRYHKTDNAIFLAIYEIILKNPETISVRIIDIVRCAGVHLSTFYRHFKTPDDVILKYENRTLSGYYKLQRKSANKKLNIRQKIYQTLFFIRNNADFFRLEFCRNNDRVVRKIFNRLTGVLEFEKFYGALKKWAKVNFDIDLLEKVVKEIGK